MRPRRLPNRCPGPKTGPESTRYEPNKEKSVSRGSQDRTCGHTEPQILQQPAAAGVRYWLPRRNRRQEFCGCVCGPTGGPPSIWLGPGGASKICTDLHAVAWAPPPYAYGRRQPLRPAIGGFPSGTAAMNVAVAFVAPLGAPHCSGRALAAPVKSAPTCTPSPGARHRIPRAAATRRCLPLVAVRAEQPPWM